MDYRESVFQNLSVNQRAVLDEFLLQGVNFLVIGGYAIRAHQYLRQREPLRSTIDLDLLVEPSAENATKIVRALRATPTTGMVTSGTHGDLCSLGKRFKFGDCDVLTDLNGERFANLVDRMVSVDKKGTPAPVIGIEDLLRAKQVGIRKGRATSEGSQDAHDILILEEMLRSVGKDTAT